MSPLAEEPARKDEKPTHEPFPAEDGSLSPEDEALFYDLDDDTGAIIIAPCRDPLSTRRRAVFGDDPAASTPPTPSRTPAEE